MKNNSYAEEIAETNLILAGLKANQERLSRRGIDEQFIANLETSHKNAITLNNEQEAFKARQKEKTAELEQELARMQKMRSEARKMVKLEMPKESWQEFGIKDKR